MTRRWLLAFAAVALALGCHSTGGSKDVRSRPNVVIVFVDDMGYGDWTDSDGIATPALDRLAREGQRSTRAYVSQPVCSASRASLLTGCYANRLGIHGALGPGARHGLAASETTIAESLKAAGWRTACFGKWHLGHLAPFSPLAHGFDEFYGIPYSNDMWPFHPESPDAWGDLPTIDGTKVVGVNTDQNRFTGDFTERGVAFIERAVEADVPFFLYLAHPMPHVPLHASADARGRSSRGLFGDVIQEIDASVGRVLDTLDELGVADDTWVMFLSDNGPWLSYGNHAGSSGGLREGKGTTFEGGVRIPAVMRWPNAIPAGTNCDTPWMTIDVLPSLVDALELEAPALPIDGKSAWNVWTQGAPSPQEAYAFYYGQGRLEAIVAGDWKLHFPHVYRTMAGRDVGRDGQPGKYDYSVRTGLELYDLSSDPSESVNRALDEPEVLARLIQLADGFRRDLGDRAVGLRHGRGLREPGRCP